MWRTGYLPCWVHKITSGLSFFFSGNSICYSALFIFSSGVSWLFSGTATICWDIFSYLIGKQYRRIYLEKLAFSEDIYLWRSALWSVSLLFPLKLSIILESWFCHLCLGDKVLAAACAGWKRKTAKIRDWVWISAINDPIFHAETDGFPHFHSSSGQRFYALFYWENDNSIIRLALGEQSSQGMESTGDLSSSTSLQVFTSLKVHASLPYLHWPSYSNFWSYFRWAFSEPF